jgi:hypothetical protein
MSQPGNDWKFLGKIPDLSGLFPMQKVYPNTEIHNKEEEYEK